MKPLTVAIIGGALILLGGGSYFYHGRKAPPAVPPSTLETPHATTSESVHSVEVLSNGEWRLANVSGKSITSTVDTPYDLAFSERRIAGSFCNVFSASMEVKEGKFLTFGPIQSTRKFCAGEPSDTESAFYSAMEKGIEFNLSKNGDALTLSSSSSAEVFEFVRRQDP